MQLKILSFAVESEMSGFLTDAQQASITRPFGEQDQWSLCHIYTNAVRSSRLMCKYQLVCKTWYLEMKRLAPACVCTDLASKYYQTPAAMTDGGKSGFIRIDVVASYIFRNPCHDQSAYCLSSRSSVIQSAAPDLCELIRRRPNVIFILHGDVPILHEDQILDLASIIGLKYLGWSFYQPISHTFLILYHTQGRLTHLELRDVREKVCRALMARLSFPLVRFLSIHFIEVALNRTDWHGSRVFCLETITSFQFPKLRALRIRGSNLIPLDYQDLSNLFGLWGPQLYELSIENLIGAERQSPWGFLPQLRLIGVKNWYGARTIIPPPPEMAESLVVSINPNEDLEGRFITLLRLWGLKKVKFTCSWEIYVQTELGIGWGESQDIDPFGHMDYRVFHLRHLLLKIIQENIEVCDNFGIPLSSKTPLQLWSVVNEAIESLERLGVIFDERYIAESL
jgi:hypothetical protein